MKVIVEVKAGSSRDAEATKPLLPYRNKKFVLGAGSEVILCCVSKICVAYYLCFLYSYLTTYLSFVTNFVLFLQLSVLDFVVNKK